MFKYLRKKNFDYSVGLNIYSVITKSSILMQKNRVKKKTES